MLPQWKKGVQLLVALSTISGIIGFALGSVAQSLNDYPIGPGDQIDITVADYPEFTGSKTVMPDGSISLPVIGQVPVASQTSTQVAGQLTTVLKQYLRNPVVTVSLTQLRPVVVTVAGEVARPGPVQLNLSRNLTAKDQNPLDLPTVPAALAAAGGVMPTSDLKNVQLKRHNSGSVTTLDLWSTLSGQTIPPSLTVQDGDVIIVPKRLSTDSTDSRLIARSVYAPKTVRVRVVGEVKRPGEVEVPPDSTLSAAVAIAGGATEKGKLSRVLFMRRDASRLQKQEIDLSNPQNDPQVQDGDLLVVPQKGGSKLLDMIGQIVPPIGILLNLIR